MDVARDDDIDAVVIQCVLERQPHALRLKVVRNVAVVPGRGEEGRGISSASDS
jgi:hypothetical protein